MHRHAGDVTYEIGAADCANATKHWRSLLHFLSVIIKAMQPLFHSIRWRLVASYTLLTLLTVSLLGVLVLSLMQGYIARQEDAYLTANAEAVARQSQPLFQPAVQAGQLYQLVQTVAFLSDAQVKILDQGKTVLADSGPPTGVDELTWVRQGPDMAALAPPYPPAFVMMSQPAVAVYSATVATTAMQQISVFTSDTITQAVASDTILVQRSPSLWGDRLEFHTAPAVDVSIAPLVTGTLPAPTFAASRVIAAPAPMADVVASVPFNLALTRSPHFVTAPIRTNGEVVGYVELSRAPNMAAEALAAIRRVFLIAAVGVSLLAVTVGLVISRGLTAPLEQLATATSRMNSGDLSVRVPVPGQDEIGLLATRFNGMAIALEQSFAALAAERDALRRFVADASHELRTPITALRTFNELLQGSAAHDVNAQREFLAAGQEQISRLERITQNLLKLSRLDGGLVELELNDHDLGAMVHAVAAPFKTLAQEKGVGLQINLTSAPMFVRFDWNQLEMALTNLLDNALKFTPVGGQIEVGIGQQADHARLWVVDSGLGIADDELSHIFERFHRGQHATGAGSGLGLAIVQSIVHAHGGTVAVTSQLGVGSQFVIQLPVGAPTTGGMQV